MDADDKASRADWIKAGQNVVLLEDPFAPAVKNVGSSSLQAAEICRRPTMPLGPAVGVV